MVRKPVVIFTSLVLLAAANAKALGLGDITLESALNQPLRANIPVLQLGDVRAEQISVQLASESDFARFSIDREAFLGSLRFAVQGQGGGTVVQVSTLDAVREPYLSFVLETRWPSGRLLSEYTVLLDLPAFADNAPVLTVQQASQASPQSLQDNQNQQVASFSSDSSSSSPVRMAAPEDALPVPTADNADSQLTAQTALDENVDAAAPIDALAAPAPQAPEPAAPPEPAASPTPRAASGTPETVTTDANDTLWDIALQVRPDSSVSVQQTMLAIQRLNTDAFIGDNINMVRRGQVLRIPDLEQIRALSSREAIGEVARQNQLFENRRNVPLSSQPVSAPPSAPADGSGAPRGELSVVSVDSAEPGTQSVSGQSAELDARIASLEDVLAVQREEADRAAILNAELTERLGLLEQQIASASEIIRLRDLELAQLQESLANAPVQQSAEAEPPTVITMAPERTFLQTLLDTLMANTIALLGVTALIISLLVFMLIKRNRAAEQSAALAGMEGMAVEPVLGEALPAATAAASEAADAEQSHAPVTASEEFDELFDLAAEAEDEQLAEGIEESSADAPDALVPEEDADALMAEVDALIAEARYPEAISLLQDSIVVQPERIDLRLKLLEVFAAAQDSIGFTLQETELLDMAGALVAPQIAVIKSRLRDSVQDEILDEGDAISFEEVAPLDDLELSLDMEASAEVDDDKVLAGFTLEDAHSSEDEEPVPEQESVVGPDEFALDDMDFDFAADEAGDDLAAAAAQLQGNASVEADFDLAAQNDAGSVEFDTGSAVEMAPELAARESAEELVEDDDNLLDFDFDLSIDDDTEETDALAAVPAPSETEGEPADNEVDFEFAVLEDDEPAPESEVSLGASAKPVSDAEEDFDFDASVFDLAVEEVAVPAKESAVADDFEDLQFVDDTLLDAIEKPAAPSEDLDDDDFEFLSDADEAATKLDLARAYYEMGDSAGAREILEEVLREGNDDQVMDARDLLSKL